MVATMHSLVVPINSVDINQGVAPSGAAIISSPSKGPSVPTATGSGDPSNNPADNVNGVHGTALDVQSCDKGQTVDKNSTTPSAALGLLTATATSIFSPCFDR
ncbi:hypothetical protein RvY_12522 [Ramazzottius varieornatus]|uniref:Uncharacterized protein n=1 Tax=Ramazzottius varieornatus TaxID=947166 RepID=A0A1D1VNZ3_RAMVA|nr:hypothetical protein RvY_12522 [Ramazzottius varieornatus]